MVKCPLQITESHHMRQHRGELPENRRGRQQTEEPGKPLYPDEQINGFHVLTGETGQGEDPAGMWQVSWRTFFFLQSNAIYEHEYISQMLLDSNQFPTFDLESVVIQFMSQLQAFKS